MTMPEVPLGPSEERDSMPERQALLRGLYDTVLPIAEVLDAIPPEHRITQGYVYKDDPLHHSDWETRQPGISVTVGQPSDHVYVRYRCLPATRNPWERLGAPYMILRLAENSAGAITVRQVDRTSLLAGAMVVSQESIDQDPGSLSATVDNALFQGIIAGITKQATDEFLDEVPGARPDDLSDEEISLITADLEACWPARLASLRASGLA